MSLNNHGESCARCHAYLFSEDDIVYCPVCGAPHHRECYNALGHCALEEFHGTDQEYSKIKSTRESEQTENKQSNNQSTTTENVCRLCGEKLNGDVNRCPKCGTPSNGAYGYFDFLGGIPADADIGDGVTAEEAKKFVLANPQRYIPKFALLNKNSKKSWNWMAFLFPCGWMLSRKMFKGGVLAGIFTVISTLLSYPFNLALYQLGVDEAQNYPELAKQIIDNLPKLGTLVLVAAIIGLIVELTTRIVCGIYGDYWYKRYTITSIKKIRLESTDQETDYRKKGGVNFFWFLLGVMILQYLPTIIVSFF